MDKVNIAQKFSLFTEQWQPHIVGELNENHIKFSKIQGEFVWHHHDNEDEMFIVIKGQLKMQFRDKVVAVNPGEFIIVPKGVEHCPLAEEETHIILIEPKGTLNTGNVENERTREPKFI